MNINEQDSHGYTRLYRAAMARDRKAIKEILADENVDPNLQDAHGRTVLHYLCENEDESAAEMILNHSGIDTNLLDLFNRSILHWACKKSMINTVRLLLTPRFHTNVRIQTQGGDTCLHWACNNVEICRLLLDAGADPTIKNQNGETAADVSTSSEVIQLLKSRTPSPSSSSVSMSSTLSNAPTTIGVKSIPSKETKKMKITLKK